MWLFGNIKVYFQDKIFKSKLYSMTRKSKILLFPLLLVFYEIATYLSNDMYLPALPQMMKELGLSLQQAQLTLTMWFIGQASMPLVMGIISDRYGRRPVLLSGGVIYILATLVCALSYDAQTLLIARLIEGGMVASMLVPGYACIHELYEQKEAIRILALMGSISVLAPAFGPLLGSLVLYFWNWRGIFWIIAVLAALAILLLNKWMPETLPQEKRYPIHFGKLINSYWLVLTNKRFMLLMFILGFIFAGFIAWITAGPLLVINNFHFTAIAFGIIQAIIFAAFIFGNRLVKSLLDKLGVKNLIHLGLAITLCGGLLELGLALVFSQALFLFLTAMTIYSFGAALCFAALNRIIIESSDVAMGVRVALFAVFLASFAVLGSGMASLFFNGSILSLACLVATAIVISCSIKLTAAQITQL